MNITRDGKPILTLVELQAFDPQAPANRFWCPLCGEEKPKDAAHRSLSLDRSSGKWKCFRCGAGGVLREFWRDNKKQDKVGTGKGGLTLRLSPGLQSRPTMYPAQSVPTNATRNVVPLQAISVSESSAFATSVAVAPIFGKSSGGGPEMHAAESARIATAGTWREKWEATLPLANTPGETYLRQRGIPLEVALWASVAFSADWNAGASFHSPDQPPGKARRVLPAVVFPIHNQGGEIVAAQARAIRGSAKLTAGSKKHGVFFAPVRMQSGRVFAPADRSTPVIAITEAPFDALSLACAGFPAMALCGTSGPVWLHIACGLRRVALALDADEAGDRASSEIEQLLIPFGAQCTRVKPVGAKDWNEMLLRDGRRALEEFLISHLMK